MGRKGSGSKARGKGARPATAPRPKAPRAAPSAPVPSAGSPGTEQPAGGASRVPAWLMLSAVAWSCFILYRALFRWDDTSAGEAGSERPWALLVLVVVSGVSSFVAFWMLRQGRLGGAVRIPLWIAAVTGIQGALVSACALASLWLLWRARKAAQAAAMRVPTGPARRR